MIVLKDVHNFVNHLSTLKLVVEFRVKLWSNISFPDWFVNGAMGIVRNTEWPTFQREQNMEELLDTVLIKYDAITPTVVTY